MNCSLGGILYPPFKPHKMKKKITERIESNNSSSWPIWRDILMAIMGILSIGMIGWNLYLSSNTNNLRKDGNAEKSKSE